MTEYATPEPAPEPGYPHHGPGGRDLGPESVSAPSQLSGLWFPFELIVSAAGRVGTAAGRPRVGAWLRRALLSRCVPIRQPLTAKTCCVVHDESCPYLRRTRHQETNSARAARGAAPTTIQLGRDAVPTLPTQYMNPDRLHKGSIRFITQPPTANRQPLPPPKPLASVH